MKKIRRIDWVVAITSIVFAVSCSGGGCGGCAQLEPIPGGFPVAKREPNAAQVRVTSTALAKIAADPASIIGPLVGGAMNGVIEFPVPASCGDPKICCVNNMPAATCGPLEIDLVKRPTDSARLVLTPVQGASRLDITVRARIKTKMDLPITYQGVSCDVNLDSTRGSTPDLVITTQMAFPQDTTTGTTRIGAQSSTVTLENADIQLSGNFACSIAGAFIGTVRGILEDQVASLLEDQINSATCKACASGQIAECGSSFATACTGQTCMVGTRCLQEVGMTGRARGLNLFGGFSPGTTGALDLYEVLGGYADTNNGGIALGLLGGMEPGGTARDRCGPSATAPVDPGALPVSAFFQGNARPDNNAPFDVAIGLHKWQLGQFAWAGYDGGLLCLTIGNSTVAQLSTDTLALLSRSLGKLVDTSSPMAIGLRPQSPPVITLGKNRFMTDAMMNTTLVEPLLDLKFTAMEIDFFASIDDQYVRVFTVVSDVHLPIGLQVTGMGELQPVLGDVADAFTNVSVKNSEAVTETPAELANLFPNLLGLVLPQLSGGLSPISLPSIGGLNLSVVDITAVDNDNFLAIFANLVTAMPAAPVMTNVKLTAVTEPAVAIARDPKQWPSHTPPSIALDFGDAQGQEWSYRIDDGAWSAWATNRTPTLASKLFWLPGQHKIEVRARVIGKPETIDTTPELIEVVLGTDVHLGTGTIHDSGIAKVEGQNGFHGSPGSAGCACNVGAGPGSAAPFGLVFLMIVVPMRRARRIARTLARTTVRHASKLGLVVWVAALMSLPGCSCSSDPCGDVECLPGEIAHGALGRYTSIAGDDHRVIVATYDQGLGDLVAVDVTDPAAPTYVAVDGIPDITPTYDPGTYRGGVEDPGDNVGIWSSIAMSNKLAKIAYQDRDAKALKYAYETKAGVWSSYVLDPGAGEDVGSHASIAIDGASHPAVAYLAVGNDDGAGHRFTELRLARGNTITPDSDADWSISVIAKANGTCAGLCGTGTVCVAGATAADPESCVAATTDCTGACGAGTECVMGTCTTILEEPTTTQLATGTGLFVNLVTLNDGRLAAVYYDRTKRALTIAVESSVGASTFTETVLDAVTPGDRGMWASAVVDGSGVVHVAYQDALGDQLMYTTWNGAAGTPEVVDDGQRAGDRTHNVGAASAIYLVSGAPVIAYQDGLKADVYVASKSGTTWTTTGVATTALLDGFSIAATTAHGGAAYLAWGAIDPSAVPLGSLVVEQR
ncbi:MAG: hypothetical protein JWP01_3698 [Myxococcales bacterium]|nr:hypothetical protein [Myxococcales bacterium]